jgi:hypothetical protein
MAATSSVKYSFLFSGAAQFRLLTVLFRTQAILKHIRDAIVEIKLAGAPFALTRFSVRGVAVPLMRGGTI